MHSQAEATSYTHEGEPISAHMIRWHFHAFQAYDHGLGYYTFAITDLELPDPVPNVDRTEEGITDSEDEREDARNAAANAQAEADAEEAAQTEGQPDAEPYVEEEVEELDEQGPGEPAASVKDVLTDLGLNDD